VLKAQGALTWAGVFHALADHYAAQTDTPFTTSWWMRRRI